MKREQLASSVGKTLFINGVNVAEVGNSFLAKEIAKMIDQCLEFEVSWSNRVFRLAAEIGLAKAAAKYYKGEKSPVHQAELERAMMKWLEEVERE